MRIIGDLVRRAVHVGAIDNVSGLDHEGLWRESGGINLHLMYGGRRRCRIEWRSRGCVGSWINPHSAEGKSRLIYRMEVAVIPVISGTCEFHFMHLAGINRGTQPGAFVRRGRVLLLPSVNPANSVADKYDYILGIEV